MNIFYLHANPRTCASWHADRHVLKMVIETAQLLCYAVILNGGSAPYRLTHSRHPCTLWAARSRGNFAWLRELGRALAAEYTHRYGKVHACAGVIEGAVDDLIPRGRFEEPPKVMPREYRVPDTVESYRVYYALGKGHLHSWGERPPPPWILAPLG